MGLGAGGDYAILAKSAISSVPASAITRRAGASINGRLLAQTAVAIDSSTVNASSKKRAFSEPPRSSRGRDTS